MRVTISLILILQSLISVQCQNIILNGNFELQADSVINWEPIAGSPDNINLNSLVKHYAWETNKRFFKGVKSRGFVGFAFDDKDSEVLGTKMRTPMTKDSIYRVSIKLLTGHSCMNGLEKITIGLTKKDLDKSTRPTSYNINVVELTTGQNFIEGGKWVGLTSKYKSKGGEAYLYLGNFNGSNEKYAKSAQEIVVAGEKVKSCNYLIVDEIEVSEELVELKKTISKEQGVITIEDIVFETGKWKIKSIHYQELDKIVKTLKSKNEIITITGHTDNVGTTDSNMTLSLKRANAVKEYFVKQGLIADKIRIVGKGEESPKYSNDTTIGRTKNRRVEIQ